MELKRILARDSRSANEKAIQLYGPGVLIISSQKLDHQTELIVAVDLNDAEAPKDPLMASNAQSMPAQRSQLDGETPVVPFSKLFQSASAFAPLEAEDDKRLSKGSPMVGSDKSLGALAVGEQAQPFVAQAEFRDTASQAARHEAQRSHEIVDLLRAEMAALRKEFSLSRQMQPWQDALSLSPSVQRLTQVMSDLAVPAAIRALLTDSIRDIEHESEAIRVMNGLLMGALERAQMDVPDSGVHAICGPSGAGKSAMVARLAHAAALRHGVERQVMVSFADQRPGAWSQMQMLAAQAGVACYRAIDSDMLQTLLNDMHGKTVWIDTSGADFLAQAERLGVQHPQVLRHAVLPVDATVTSVQKILQHPHLTWTSLMLSKWDEAANPWALIKGLTENALPVSCVSTSSLMTHTVAVFEPDRLVQLALSPLSTDNHGDTPVAIEKTDDTAKPVQRSRARKSVDVEAVKMVEKPKSSPKTKSKPLSKVDDILIPTLLAPPAVRRSVSRNALQSTALKVVNG